VRNGRRLVLVVAFATLLVGGVAVCGRAEKEMAAAAS
jgi:hypothetical protein